MNCTSPRGSFILNRERLSQIGGLTLESIEATKSWNISENVRTNLKKIEELYLHTIEQQKKIEMLMQSLQALEYKLNERMKKK